MGKIKYIGIAFFMVVNILLFYPVITVYAGTEKRNNSYDSSINEESGDYSYLSEIDYATGDEFNTDNGTIDITVSGIRKYDVASEIFDIVNSERSENSLRELKMDEELTEAAMKRAEEIAVFYSHTRPNGTKWFSICSNAFGENIAYGYRDAADVMNGWMNSSGHKANILNDYGTSIGIGCYSVDGFNYYVQLFGFSSKEYTPKQNSKTTPTVTTRLDSLNIDLITDFDYIYPNDEKGGYENEVSEINIYINVRYTTLIDLKNNNDLKLRVSDDKFASINGKTLTLKNAGEFDLELYSIKHNKVLCSSHYKVSHKEVTDYKKNPTCIEDGLTEGSHCSICGKVLRKQDKIPATGHTVVNDLAIKETCTTNGKTAGSHCSVCGTVITAQQTVKATGHSWDSGKVTKAATCTAKGVKTYTCTKCKVTKTEDIPAKGHKAVTDAAVAATCTKAGKTAGSHCSVCGTVITAQQTVKATGHSWDSGKITTQPTTTSTGVKTYTCTNCKTTKTETIPKLKQEKKAGVSYTTHIQSIGWQGVVRNGELAGTVGDSKRLEAIKINLEDAPYSGNIEYRTHVQTYGWQGWVKNGALSGTSGQAKRLEAIQIRLTGEIAKHYDVYYRIQVQSFGWLGWAKNGEYSGSAGYAKRLEAIQIVLVEKGKSIDRAALNKQGKITSSTKITDDTPYVAKAPSIHYQTHVQSYGWQDFRKNGEMSGTSGQAKRLEGIKINLSKPPYDGGIRYKTHIQSIGWQDWRYDGEMSGTSGQAKRLEAISIELTGDMAEHFDVYYRVHAQSYGWLSWAKNGQNAGTEGYAKRLEGIQIVLVEKGKPAPGKTYNSITSNMKQVYISK